MANGSKKTRSDHDQEIARAVSILRSLPIEILRFIAPAAIVYGYRLKISRNTFKPIFQKHLEAREARALEDQGGGAGDKRPELGAQLALEELAKIVTKTYAYCGDGETISAEDAQRMILRRMRRYDVSLLTRNEKRKPLIKV